MNPPQPHQSWIGYAVSFAIILVVFGLRMKRMGRMRPLKLETLWIVPAVYCVISLLMFLQLPPTGLVAIATGGGFAVGAAVGWARGTMMHIHVDPTTHALNQQASPAAMIFLILLVVVRSLGRGFLGASGVSPALITDPLIAFALGMLTLSRVEMYFRAKRLLQEASSGT